MSEFKTILRNLHPLRMVESLDVTRFANTLLILFLPLAIFTSCFRKNQPIKVTSVRLIDTSLEVARLVDSLAQSLVPVLGLGPEGKLEFRASLMRQLPKLQKAAEEARNKRVPGHVLVAAVLRATQDAAKKDGLSAKETAKQIVKVGGGAFENLGAGPSKDVLKETLKSLEKLDLDRATHQELLGVFAELVLKSETPNGPVNLGVLQSLGQALVEVNQASSKSSEEKGNSLQEQLSKVAAVAKTSTAGNAALEKSALEVLTQGALQGVSSSDPGTKDAISIQIAQGVSGTAVLGPSATPTPTGSVFEDANSPAPVVISTAPAFGAAVQSSVVFTGQCTAGLVVSFSGSGVLPNPQTAECTAEAYTILISLSDGDGIKAIQIGQTNASGKSSVPLAAVVRRDNVAPVVSLSAPSVASVNNTSNITFSVSFSDDMGMNSVTLADSDVTLNTAGGASCSKAVSGSGTGLRTVTLSGCTGNGTVGISLPSGIAADLAGNTSLAPSASSTFTVDNNGPALAFSSPAASSFVAASFVLSGTCEGTTNVAFSGTDVSAPSVACSGGNFSATVSLSGSNGSKTLTATQLDAVGNSTSINRNFSFDSAAPTLTSSAPAANTPAQAALIFSGYCETGLLVWFTGSGVASSQSLACSAGSYTGSINLSAGDGAKSVALAQTDAAGNVSAPLVVIVRRDNAPPVASVSAPSAASVNNTANITYTVSFSDDIGLNSASLADGDVTLNTTSGVSCTKAVSGTGTGPRTVTLSGCTGNGTVGISLPSGMATDLAGNTSLAPGASSTFTVDNSAPTLAVTSPSDNATVKATTTVAGTCETGFAVLIAGPITSSPVSAACAGNGFSQALTLMGADGVKALSFSTLDAAGNSALTSLSLVRDTLSPALTISSPASNTLLGSTTSASILSGNCEAGLNVNLEGSDVPAGQTTTCPSGSYSFAAGAWSVTSGDGTKTVVVSQTDAAGNKGTTNVAVVLDITLPPPATFSAVSVVNGLKYSFTGSCDSSAAYTLTSVASNIGTVVSSSCVANVLRANVTALPSGSNTLTLTPTMTRISNGLTRVTTANFNQQFFCPPGYVGVPGKFATDSDTAGLGNVNASAGHADAGLDPTKDFCVMKYPAKAATSNSGGQSPWEEIYDGSKTINAGATSFARSNVWPQSRAAGTPWVNISRDDALDRCKALNEAYGLCSDLGCYSNYANTTQGFRLMSNTQWQVMARNMEATGANWTSGTVGTGFLWRGHVDDALGSNTDLHSQTFGGGGGQKLLSHPRFDGAATDYFGTGNTVSQNSTGTAGWQERRRLALSTGASLWDVSGNMWNMMSDNNSSGAGTSGDMGVSSTLRLSTAGDVEYSHSDVTVTDRKLFGSFGGYTSSVNAGQISGGTGVAVIRGGDWADSPSGGLFRVWLGDGSSNVEPYIGFRCTFIPPPLTGPVDTGVPTVTLQRTTSTGTALGSNSAVTVAAGGFWHLGFAVSDAENTGVDANKLWIQVRRKIANGQTNADYPVLTDAIYREGLLPTFQLPNTYTGTAAYGLADETAWTMEPTTLKYTRNDSKYVNYLVTVIDPSGNKSDATVGNGGTLSINNTQSCPQGYVGVPGMNGSGSAWNDPAINGGLGNVNATAGNSNKSLDISNSFCVMKFPAKIQSANTTVAASYVGGKLEPIANGNKTFDQADDNYVNAGEFDSNIRYLPDSRPTGTPWVNVGRDASILACRSLQMGYLNTMPDTSTGTGFQLLSNTQWQMMARNAEAQPANWSNNAVGSGALSSGHTDNTISTTEVLNRRCFGCTAPTPGSAAPNSINDLNAYFATGSASSFASWNTLGASPAAGAEQRRVNVLSNGAVLHDMGGNVLNAVTDNRASLGILAGDETAGLSSYDWYSFRNGGANRFSATVNLIFGALGSGGLQFPDSVNAGEVHGWNNAAVMRGGEWGQLGSGGGMFSATLAIAPWGTGSFQGFRCVFVP